MMTAAAPTGRKFTLLFLALLAIGIGVAYSGSLGIGFLFDDQTGIVKNPAIRSLGNIPSFFVDPFTTQTDHTQVDLRPVLLITYAANYAISALEPWSYHLFNLVLHFIASALVFVIVRDQVWWPASDRGPDGAARIPAAAAALFFALAPLNSQPVDYLSARSALLCVPLYLGAFLAYLRQRWVIGSLLFALALLTKAIAMTLPAALLIYAFVYYPRPAADPSVRGRTAQWRRVTIPLLLTTVLDLVYLAYRNLLLPPWAAEARHPPWVTPWVWFMSQWSGLLHYVRLFLWPDGLSVDHDVPFTTSFLVPRAWGSLLILLLWVALALLARPRYPQVTFATGWFFVTLAAESSFIGLGEVINDHRPYIASSLGLSVLLAWLLYEGAARLAPRLRQVAFVFTCLILLVPAIGFDRYRTWQWGDALRLWEDTVRTSPRNPRAWVAAAGILMVRGDQVKARRYLEQARELAPEAALVYMNLSVLETREGHLDAALRAAAEAVRLRPDRAVTHDYLGQALEKAGRTAEAAAAYRRALDLDPRAAEPRARLARLAAAPEVTEEAMMKIGLDALYSRQSPAEAAIQFQKVLRRNPTHYGATFQLATALDRAGKPAEARPLWEKVLSMAEGYGDKATAETARSRLRNQP